MILVKAARNRLLLLFFTCISTSSIFSQKDSLFDNIAGAYYLDSVVVSASRQGFNIGDFIKMVQNDKTFYRAFRQLRFVNYTSENSIFFYDKKGRKTASHKSKTTQTSDGRCREMTFHQVETEGNYYEGENELKYYTAKLFERLFYSYKRTCGNADNLDLPEEIAGSGMEKHVLELKKLIFTPGVEADVPFMGQKMAIFSPEMADYYDFSITSGYKNGKDCYVFTARVKPGIGEDKTVVKLLETYFEKGNLQVIGRNYHLSYKGWFFDFDVLMKIDLTKIENYYFPAFIAYKGYWDIPAKRPEISEFSAWFYNMDLPEKK